MRIYIKTLLISLGFSVGTITIHSQSLPDSTSKKIDSLSKKWDNNNSPGCTLGIVKDAQLIYKRGYGMANLEYGIPITPTTRFHAGSMSKQFTATAIALLAQERKLSLDDNVRKYIPELPDFGTPITIRHLIHHTSGLRDQVPLLGLAGWRIYLDLVTRDDVLEVVSRQRELNFRPAEKYEYSNTNYTLLAHGQEPGMRRPNPRDGLQYVWIPAGTFQMGCVPGDDECSERTKPRHSVRITKGFWMGQTEVTVAAYKRFLDATIERVPEPPDFNAGWQKEDHPIVNVTFRQAAHYCEWAGGRLPTEAEWEYAGRGGIDGLKYPWGNTLTHEDANYGKDKPWGGLAQGPDLWEYTAPVGSFRPNGYGLYDMTGNVSEWVTDWLGEMYYSHSPLTDPQGPPTATSRVVRGGAWFGYPGSLRLSTRIDVGHIYIGPGVGFRCVLTTDANASPPNDDVRTALMRTAREGHKEAVSALLAGGADVNASLKNGQTALMGAAFGGHTETVKTLLANGADVNANAKDGRTALMFGAGEGQSEAVHVLVAAGAKVNAADKYGETALMGAARHGHNRTVKPLLAAGANINATDNHGITALMQAAIGGHTETLKELLAAGANVNARGRGGATALRVAKYKKYSDIVVLLQKAGAEE